MKNKGLIIGIIIAVSVIFVVGGILAVFFGVKVINNLSSNKNSENTSNITEEIKKDENKDEDENENETATNVLNDNDSYFILINGKKFYAGDKISDLKSVNYSISNNEIDEDVPAKKYLIGAGTIVTSENKRTFNVTPYNPTASSVKVPDSVIGGISISDSNIRYDENLSKFEVYGGIKLGSTIDEVKKVFGEPSWSSEGKTTYSSTISYRYYSDETYRDYSFTFNEEGKVSGMSWQNLVYNKK